MATVRNDVGKKSRRPNKTFMLHDTVERTENMEEALRADGGDYDPFWFSGKKTFRLEGDGPAEQPALGVR